MKKSFDIDISTILCVNLNIKTCQQKCYRAFEIVRIWFHAQQVLVSKLVGIQRTAGNCWFCHHQLRTLPAAHLAPRSNSIPKQRAVTTTTTTKTTTTTTTTSTTLMVMTTSTIQPASYRFGKDIKFNPGVVCSENKKFSHTLSSKV